MCRMNTGKKRRKIAKGIARALTVSLLFGLIGSHAEAWTITAQAKEGADEYDYSMMEGGGVLSLGDGHSAVIKNGGSLWMWGANREGQLGNGGTENSFKPKKIIEDVKTVSLGGSHSATIKTDGSLWIWGCNDSGQLGDGTKKNSSIPIKIMEDVRAVSLGGSHSAAIKTDGSLWIWGNNRFGSLGNGTEEDSSIPIKIMEDVRAVSLGGSHSAAIKTDGSLWIWGMNRFGGLGNETGGDSFIPIKIMEDVRTVSLGWYHSAAIKTDGSLWTWGINFNGELGKGTSEYDVEITKPSKIMEDVRAVSLGGSHSAAIKTDGSLWMWGFNREGQLGNGTSGYGMESTIPIKIMEGVKAVSLRGNHSAAVKIDGSLWMWGWNSYGQLGDGTEKDSYVPIQIMPAGSISVPGTSPSDPDDGPIKLPIDTEVSTKPQIKVVDAKGTAIADAEITYNGKTFKTSKKGIAELDNYVKGKLLTISKANYKTITISSFVRSKSGRLTYTLAREKGTSEISNEDKLADIMSSVILSTGNERIDLLTKEAQINTYFSDKEFSIECAAHGKHDKYLLYSGSQKIAESNNGSFMKLRSDFFTVGQPVYLCIQNGNKESVRKKLNLNIVNAKPPMDYISLVDGLKITIPEDVPLVGGDTFEIETGNLPVECNYKSDGTLEAGINIGELMNGGKDFDDIFSALKQLNKANVSSFLGKNFSPYAKASIKPDFKIVGYLESNVYSWDYLQGKLFIEFSLTYSNENQLFAGPIPVVVELSIEGKINVDGSIKWSAQEGIEGSIGIGGGIGLGVYAGVGIANVASAGVYGSGELGMHYVILPEDNRGVDELYIEGQLGLEAKLLGNSYKHSLLEKRKYIIGGDAITVLNDGQAEENGIFLSDYEAYTSLGRGYLTADGEMPEWRADAQIDADGNVEEKALQSATCLDLVPQVIRMGDMVMLFYLTDAGTGRNAADRSMLVYSLWDRAGENWSEPKAVLDDGTADFSPDLYTDGEKIYAVWQNAEKSLTDGMTLNEITDSLTLHAAVYDKEKNVFVSLGSIESENGVFQQNPQIAADGGRISVYWYENQEDNVLGLSGTNRIYRAVLQNDSPESKESGKEEEDQKETVSGNTVAEDEFRKFVGLTAEEPEGIDPEETVTEEKAEGSETEESETSEPEEPGTSEPEESGTSETEEPETSEPEEPETSDIEKPEISDTEGEPEETVSENTISEETVSENTISENTIQNIASNEGSRSARLWTVTFLQEEGDCIVSSDAGKVNGETGYAYAAGRLDAQYNVSSGRVVFLKQSGEPSVLGDGEVGKVEFSSVYADQTLTWYQDGDIRYLNEGNREESLFGENRLFTSSYTLLSDGAGNPEVVFPVNRDGKSNLYRIGHENGVFQAALQITDQENYIQYADGFVDGGRTILVYNRMQVDNVTLEEKNNSLCTGTIMHSYCDIVMQSVGSMVRQNTETGEDVLEINARLYNNGTVKAENLSLTLAKADGTQLETVPIDTLLESGETGYGIAVFDLSQITETAEYTVTVSMSGGSESSTGNNGSSLVLGEASLQVEAEMIAVADTRTVHAGIRNTGVTACGGTVSVRDVETGIEYCSGAFEPISAGMIGFVEIDIDPAIFGRKDTVALEIVVTPDQEGVEITRDFVMTAAPVYEVNFVTDADVSTVYAGYGKTVEFPANPVKDGAHFAGWYDTQDAAGGTFYTEETQIKSDVTLYARFIQEQASIPLESCSVLPIPMQYYTGGQIKPKVTVKWGSEVLKANKDYKVTYQNNKAQGTAKVTIAAVTGTGKRYTGSITRTFSIMYPTGKVSVKAISAVNFTGDAHTPEPVVTYQKKPLTKGKDYTVSYFDNRNAGTAGVIITGKGTFSGEKTVTFKINGTAISSMKFDRIPDVIYNSTNTRPVVTIRTKDGKTQLMSGSDYRLVYENTVNKGTATVTVIGNGNYTGTKKLTYKVTAKPLAESMIAVEQLFAASADQAGQPSTASSVAAPEKAVYTYTGKVIKPALVVTDAAAGDKALVLNKDYTVSYSKNKAVGEALITVKGKGNYGGTVKVPFTISPVDLAQAKAAGKIEVRVNDAAYTGKALRPAVQLYETADGMEKKIPAGGYTLTYTDNTEKGIGTVTVTGKEMSGYTGTVTAQFRIVDKAKLITASGIKVDAIPAQTYTGNALEPVLHIVDKSDKTKEVTLEKGTHYEVAYRNNVDAGKAAVTIKGVGSYAGSKTVTFRINKRAIADKNVLGQGFSIEQMPDLKYTGYAQKPDVIIKDNGGGSDKQLVQGKDYKLSYQKNTNIGTAKVTVKGMGNYSGSVNTVTFGIVGWDYSTLTAEAADQVYTGKALKPQITFYITGTNGREEISLKVNTAVKIAYKDNKNAGTATVTVSGKGVLKDIAPVTASFEIERADITDAVVSRIANQTLKGTAVKPIPKVKVGKNSLKAGRDFEVSYLRNGVKGEATAIIRGVGNYIGECRKTFIVQ